MSSTDKVQPFNNKANNNNDEVYEGDTKDVRFKYNLNHIDEKVES